MVTLQKTKVSVLMSVYNDARYVGETVESILRQTFTDFEFIIINDGSTDGTKEVIESFRDPRIILVNRENKGLTKSLNEGIKLSRGQYIARQDADDISLPHRLEKQVTYMDDNPEVAVLGSSFRLINVKGKKIKDYHYPTTHDEIKKCLFAFQSAFPHTSVIFRKDKVQELGEYNERFVRSQDYDLWLRVCQRFEVASLSEPLVCLRFREDSISFSGKEVEQLKYGMMILVCAWRREKGLSDLSTMDSWENFKEEFDGWFMQTLYSRRWLAKKHYYLARSALCDRKYTLGLKHFIKATNKDPFWWSYRGIGLDLDDLKRRFVDWQ